MSKVVFQLRRMIPSTSPVLSALSMIRRMEWTALAVLRARRKPNCMFCSSWSIPASSRLCRLPQSHRKSSYNESVRRIISVFFHPEMDLKAYLLAVCMHGFLQKGRVEPNLGVNLLTHNLLDPSNCPPAYTPPTLILPARRNENREGHTWIHIFLENVMETYWAKHCDENDRPDVFPAIYHQLWMSLPKLCLWT